MRTKLLIAFLLLSFTAFTQTEVTFYDEKGNGVCYLNIPQGTFYSFSGDAVGFIVPATTYSNIYNYQGKHIGRVDQGLIVDRNGNISGFQSAALSNITKPDPIKAPKKYNPVRPPVEPAFPKVPCTLQFSRTTLSLFFYENAVGNYQSPNPYNVQPYIPKIEPFQPDFNMLQNVLSTLQARHDQLSREGYFYDVETDQYIAPQDFSAFRQKRIDDLKNLIIQYAGSKYFKQKEPVTDGEHYVYFLNATAPYPIVYRDVVIVKNGEIKKMIINNKTIKMVGDARIDNGMAAAKMKQNFGFLNGTAEYPLHLFLFTE